MIFYLRACLLHGAGIHVPPDSPFDLDSSAPVASRHVNQLLDQSGLSAQSPVLVYIGLMQQLLNAVGSHDVMRCLLEIVAIAAGRMAKQFVDKLVWIKVQFQF